MFLFSPEDLPGPLGAVYSAAEMRVDGNRNVTLVEDRLILQLESWVNSELDCFSFGEHVFGGTVRRGKYTAYNDNVLNSSVWSFYI
jgi:hypothetical protein